ncbi:hypothetical protein HY387_00465 [Candidatus Daviesbacteria bacterium]|nr:hypothetical protein [Candidatus Daviesbacteria bacterium]
MINLVNKFSAQKGPTSELGVVSPIIIVVGVVVLIAVVLLASGALKFSANIKSGSQPSSSSSQKAPEKPKVELTETYTNQDLGISIKYPNKWEVDTSQKVPIIYSTDWDAKSANDSPAGVILASTKRADQTKDMSKATVYDIRKIELQKEYPGATFGEDKDIQLGSIDAHVYEFTYVNVKNDFEGRYYLVVTENKLYGLLATAIKAKWADYEDVLSRIVQTLTLL